MMMFEFLLRAFLDKTKNVGVVQLEYAVTRGWITESEKNQILGAESLSDFNLV